MPPPRLTAAAPVRILCAVIYRAIKLRVRFILFIFTVAALPVIGVLALIYVDGLFRIIVPVAAFFVAYHVMKFAVSHLKSYIETGSDGLSGLSTINESLEFSWAGITDAGRLTGKSASMLFVYDEAEDRLLTIPQEYRGWRELEQEIRDNVGVPFQEIELKKGEDAREKLKSLLASEQESQDT